MDVQVSNLRDRKPSLMEIESLREQRLKHHRKCLKQIFQENLEIPQRTVQPVFTLEVFVSSLSDTRVTEHIFGQFDIDGVGYLQFDWVDEWKVRSKTQLQTELAELLDTATYLVCGDRNIGVEQFGSILNAKGVARKLFAVFSEAGNGTVTIRTIMDFISRLTNTTPNTSFTKENLEWLESLFRAQVGNAEELRLDDFTKIVNSKNAFFAERVFEIFDRDGSGSVSLPEFLDAMHRFAGKSHEDKIQFLFRVYDIDGDGLIQHKELQHVLQACMHENGMQFSDEQVSDLTSALFEDADVEGRGEITYEALKAQLEKHDGLLENLSTSIDRWLVPVKPPSKSKNIWKRISALKPYQCSLPYIKNNYAYLSFLTLYLAIHVGLVISRGIQFREKPPSYMIARICGQCLNFNCAFILVVMLRNVITFARTHGMASYLPLDEHIYFHKMCGWLILAFGLVHTLAHFINLAVNVVPSTGRDEVNEDGWSYMEWLFTIRPGRFGLIEGVAFPTGVALILILTVMVICSQPFVRKKGNFEVFYRTHLLYVPFLVLTVVHCSNYWKWLVVPGVVYLVERVVRLVRTRTGTGRTFISSGILLPSKVTHLVIKRPASMVFHPGDYVFVNIPVIAKYEWHPFTISSAPEQSETLWLHIRAVGGWTHRLFEYFEEHQMRLECMGDAHGDGDGLSVQTSASHKLIKAERRMTRKKAETSRKNGSSGRPTVICGTANKGFSGDVEVAMTPIGSGVCSDSNNDESKPDSSAIQVVGKDRRRLNKTISMPDMQQTTRERQHKLDSKQAFRSVSESVFTDSSLHQAHSQVNQVSYKNPKNKSVAKSFRYMRRKPTIIAFKTPSSDSLEPPGRKSVDSELDEKSETDLKEVVAIASEGNKNASPYPIVAKPLEIYLDGPYGAPSSHIFRAQHAVLIGTGIGVTPFASILQSIMHRYWQNRHVCPSCSHQWTDQLPESVMNLKKVDFFWINRDQRSFEWFVNLLSQLEIEQAELGGVMDRFLDMHMYITSALQRTDMKAVGLQLALELLHEKEKRDMITGLKTRTIAGRPNWNKVFRQIRDQNKGKVTVFFCGPPQLSRVLRYKCDEFGFKFRKENF